MSDIHLNSAGARGMSGGGAATSAGIVFEQQLGALFAVQILSGSRVDARLGLGDASPIWLRFETEAPVDDILIATSNDGFIAIQAKTTVPLSANPNGPFSKTIEQFVRHWFECKKGDGTSAWNRPLDPTKDRLVLAVSPEASASIRIDLSTALQLHTQPGGHTLNQKQQHALAVFETCISAAWQKITSDPFPPQIIQDLSRLISVLTINVDSTDSLNLLPVISPDQDMVAALSVLTTICGSMMARRSGADLSLLRTELASRGIKLASSPRYQADIATLCQHSMEVANALKRYEEIESQSGTPVTLRRDCQDAVEDAAISGSLLLIGEPGSGKSGVLNALARTLREQGGDVLELAVDRYSVDSLDGLAREIGLEHSLIEVIKAWDGPSQGWLIIDALDATRGGKGEAIFRTLIEQVLEHAGRWRVIASIRSFDLRMGVKFRDLFKGLPPVSELSDPLFDKVRHIRIPNWSDNEFEQLLTCSPGLAGALQGASERLKELFRVPFNTRLLGELIVQNTDINLSQISSQTELLELYWQRRIEKYGLPAKECLKTLVDFMIENRSLRAAPLSLSIDTAMIDILSSEGVLIRDKKDRWVQFRHHLLFDYAAAQIFFNPEQLISGRLRFSKQKAQGLMLSPALGFVLQEIWNDDPNHNSFWKAVGHLVSDKEGDPIIRSAAGRIAAEYPAQQEDALWLAEQVTIHNQLAVTTLSHISGALAIRIEDEKNIELHPWVYLTSALATHTSKVADTQRFLLHMLVKQVTDESLRAMLGVASRALLSYGLGLSEPGAFVRSAIYLVTDTFDTDVYTSSTLLEQLIDPTRLQSFGSEEIPIICYNIKKIGKYDPSFVTKIFAFVYGYDVTEDRKTSIGSSQILALNSNARQDYESARYSLSEYFPHFVEYHPEQAIDAVISAVDGYVSRKHSITEPAEKLSIAGKTIHLQPDRSYIWAHDPDSTYSHDAEVLIQKLLEKLRTTSESNALELAKLICEKASSAILWSRLFLAANSRKDNALIDLLWPIAVQEPFITQSDTTKDSIDLISRGFLRRSDNERKDLEGSVFRFDFSDFHIPEEAKTHLLHRLFNSIGFENLSTDVALDFIKNITSDDVVNNERPFKISPVSVSSETRYGYIPGLDTNEPNNNSLIESIESAKKSLELLSKENNNHASLLDDIFKILDPVHNKINQTEVHSYVRKVAEDVIVRGCASIVEKKILPTTSLDSDTTREITSHFLELLRFASYSISPEILEDTEESFENSVSWGSPAPRIDAAQILLDLLLIRPDLYNELKPEIETMLDDLHPAVRLQASIRLIRLWNIDREGLWVYLDARIKNEENLGVIQHLISDVVGKLLHTDPQRAFNLIQDLLKRFKGSSERKKRVNKIVCNILAILWVTHKNEASRGIIDDWITEPTVYTDELTHILQTLREAFVLGLSNPTHDNIAIRQRSLDIAFNIIDSASKVLEEYYSLSDQTDAQKEDAKQCAHLIDTACSQLRYSYEGKYNKHGAEFDHNVLNQFLNETQRHLKRIGDYGTPHTIYYLLELLDTLIPVNPAMCFDLMTHALRHGTRSGFQFESMGMDLLVKMTGVFLADYKQLFEDQDRRNRLIESLDIFMEAGWPAARRLLYRLPELIQ
ncbi:ATP-binding protein [Hafnia alvei]|uniref:ATP-binding protein n=1 Tax=Hafnia alvei TaxID=569 RepID=UPI0028BED9CC|nr:ATP-binding protein [Hafnia alvei]WNN53249.1 ATP-binding protein [Hafnia alvei]